MEHSKVKGVGIDLMQIDELSQLLKKRWFIDYIYTESEQAICENWERHRRAEFLTGRFCAKEAIYKALPNSQGLKISPREIVIHRDENRKPSVDISNPLLCHGVNNISLSITHKGNICASVAIVY